MKTKWEQLFAAAREKLSAAKALLESDNPDMAAVKALQDEATQLKARAESLKAIDGELGDINTPQMPAPLPMGGDGSQPAPAGTGGTDPVIKSVNILRYGDVDEHTDRVMREVYGGDYRQLQDQQVRAFKTYLRTGQVSDRVLTRQLWDINSVKAMLQDGMTVAEIKTTMVEGQDVLGGFAVPPAVGSQIISRLPGLTAVRGGGALVIQTASKMIEWLKVTGGNDRYPSGLRGTWGAETQSPEAKNFEVGLLQIPVHVYTYKTPVSVSLVEDATNLLDVFVRLVSDTLALDEDDACLIGDGAGKPRGLLPSSANAHSLTEVVSGAASALTFNGLKALRRGVASQYRAPGRASWIGNSDTGGDIEQMVDGTGRHYVESLDVGQPLLRSTWRESEAMPDVASSAFPLLFGDLSGYAIVERLGLSLQRYNDSNTGINVIEFHVRRRIGGNVIEPWKFAVQKVAAS